jgi:hypothetical protein
MKIDYLLLGHFTRDVLPDGKTTPGGTSLYAALTAQRVGRSVGVVSAPAELPANWPRDIQMVFHQSPTPPTFENRYTPLGRQQTLHTASAPITLDAIPAEWGTAPLVHLGPVLGETPQQLVHAFPGALLGVTPQGWMRTWDEPLPGPVIYRPWRPDPAILARIDALVLSIEDVRGDEALAASYAEHCPLVVVTRSAKGATLFLRGEPHAVPAFAAEARPNWRGGRVRRHAVRAPPGNQRPARVGALRGVCGGAQRRRRRRQPHPDPRRTRAGPGAAHEYSGRSRGARGRRVT